jgi:hypothetical protein
MKTCTDHNTGDMISVPISQREEKEKALKQGNGTSCNNKC